MKLVTRFVLSLIVLSALVSGHLLSAQGTDLGTISGLVTDTTGAVVPNAKVVVLDLATNSGRETKSNAQGEYRVFGLPSGEYKALVSASGMGTTQVTGIQIKGSDEVTANAVLKVGAATEAIQVTSEAPLVNTTDQTISEVDQSLASKEKEIMTV